MSRYAGCTIFVGNLPGDVREREVEDLFYKYGRVVNIDLKTPPRPPAFAFVEFEDPRDAQDAVTGRDNYDFHGSRLRVEISHGRARDRGAGGGGFGGGGGYSERGGRGGGYLGAADILERSRNKGTAYRAIVKGLPASASWQDLKDHFRKVVKPSYTNVVRDRAGAMGIVEFETADDLDRAIRKLDDTEFRNPFDRGYIRIIEDDGGRGGGGRGSKYRSRSRSRARSHSRSYSRSRSKSRSRSTHSGSRSPSRSPSKSRSGSKSRSPSRPRSASPQRDGEKAMDAEEMAPEASRSPSP